MKYHLSFVAIGNAQRVHFSHLSCIRLSSSFEFLRNVIDEVLLAVTSLW